MTAEDLEIMRKARMINFIQHNYSHRDFVIVNRVINEQYQKETNNEFAEFNIKRVGKET